MQTLKEEIREKILEHSKKIFIIKGYDKTTMRDIASKCNISVGNIYRYFSNKDKILEELVKDFEEDFNELIYKIDKDVDENHTGESRLKKYSEELLEVFKKNETAIYVLFQDGSNAKFVQVKAGLIDKVSNVIFDASKKFKSKHFNETISNAIATGILAGMKSIISRLDKKKENFQKIRKDLKIYLYFILNDLMNRLQSLE